MVCGALAAAAVGSLAGAESATQGSRPRAERAPRKVVVGTAVQAFWGKYPGLEGRLEQLEGTVAQKDVDAAKAEADSLTQRLAAVGASVSATEALVAPVSGVIAAANAAPGLIAETQRVVFHIVDPARLWVEALSYGGEPIGARASAASGETSLSLSFVGAGVAEQGRARPLHFRIEDGATAQPGAMLTVLAETEDAVDGARIETAVLERALKLADRRTRRAYRERGHRQPPIPR